MRVPYFRLRYFVWVIVPVGLCVGWQIYGLPHFAWSYTYVGPFYRSATPTDPFSGRRYITCTYIGSYGTFTVPARDENCPWFRFFREDG